MAKDSRLILDPLTDNNPITIQVLGICSALAITAELEASILQYALANENSLEEKKGLALLKLIGGEEFAEAAQQEIFREVQTV